MANAGAGLAAAAGAGRDAGLYATLPEELEGVSDKQLDVIREAFMSFASGDSLILMKTDLAACLRVLNFRVTELEVRKLVEEFAPGSGGRIDYMAFLAIVARQTSAIKKPEAQINAFRLFDPDRKGYVTVAEFRKIVGRMGSTPLPAERVDEMVAYADPDDTGMVQYESFVARLFGDFQAMEKAKQAAKDGAKKK